jgi:four helix bundle protein
MRKFKELEIWKLAKEITLDVYKLTEEIPSSETYGLASQMRRCSVSMPSNIAEGCSRSSNKDFVRFLGISLGSSFELETQLIITEEVGLLNSEKISPVITKVNKFQQQTNSFIQSVKKF